jgi:uncharacterized protein (DUF2062 family)
VKDWLHKKFIVKLLELGDPPEKIARGIAVGTFISITPTAGVQTIIAIALATIMKGNRLAAALFTWISNYATALPILWVNYTLGAILMGKPLLSWHGIKELVHLKSIGLVAEFCELVGNIWHIFIPMLIGSIIFGTILSVIAYFISLPLLRKHHERKKAKRLEKEKGLATEEGPIVSRDSVTAKPEPPLQDRK